MPLEGVRGQLGGVAEIRDEFRSVNAHIFGKMNTYIHAEMPIRDLEAGEAGDVGVGRRPCCVVADGLVCCGWV